MIEIQEVNDLLDIKVTNRVLTASWRGWSDLRELLEQDLEIESKYAITKWLKSHKDSQEFKNIVKYLEYLYKMENDGAFVLYNEVKEKLLMVFYESISNLFTAEAWEIINLIDKDGSLPSYLEVNLDLGEIRREQ